jgi:hypothetical protein
MLWLFTNIIVGVLSSILFVAIYLAVARRTQLWAKAIVFGALSAALIVLIYVTPSPEPGFAGAAFGYNFSFFFPVLLSSFLFWIVALALYVGFLRGRAIRSMLKILLPPVLLLPLALQVGWMIFLFVHVQSSV